MKKSIIFLLFALSIILPNTVLAAKKDIPGCKSVDVLKTITRKFNKAEKIYWKKRGLELEMISRVRLRSNRPYKHSSLKRRTCTATAIFDNGRRRSMHFMIEAKAGYSGFKWGVEYCIHGLDPWKYQNGNCLPLSKY